MFSEVDCQKINCVRGRQRGMGREREREKREKREKRERESEREMCCPEYHTFSIRLSLIALL